MQRDNAFDALHLAMSHAAHEGLDDYLHFRRSFEASSKLSDEERKACRAKEAELGQAAWPGEWLALRPQYIQIEVVAMFKQAWGSGSLAFGGIGSAAVTWAYNVVLKGPAGDFAVYIGGRLAYKLSKPDAETPQNANFRRDLERGMLTSVDLAKKEYGAKVPAARKLRVVKKAPAGAQA